MCLSLRARLLLFRCRNTAPVRIQKPGGADSKPIISKLSRPEPLFLVSFLRFSDWDNSGMKSLLRRFASVFSSFRLLRFPFVHPLETRRPLSPQRVAFMCLCFGSCTCVEKARIIEELGFEGLMMHTHSVISCSVIGRREDSFDRFVTSCKN